MAILIFAHVRQRGFDDVDGAEEVFFELAADERVCVGGLRELFDGADKREGFAD